MKKQIMNEKLNEQTNECSINDGRGMNLPAKKSKTKRISTSIKESEIEVKVWHENKRQDKDGQKTQLRRNENILGIEQVYK